MIHKFHVSFSLILGLSNRPKIKTKNKIENYGKHDGLMVEHETEWYPIKYFMLSKHYYLFITLENGTQMNSYGYLRGFCITIRVTCYVKLVSISFTVFCFLHWSFDFYYFALQKSIIPCFGLHIFMRDLTQIVLITWILWIS